VLALDLRLSKGSSLDICRQGIPGGCIVLFRLQEMDDGTKFVPSSIFHRQAHGGQPARGATSFSLRFVAYVSMEQLQIL